MKMIVLSPAGNMDSVKVAVFNGADEIYLGVNEFNARNNIDGFSIETLKQAIDFAHIYGVRVFLAVNILFKNEELQDALNLVVKAYNQGVDAVIMQDVGLISLVAKNYPEIEIHASTQMGIHNLEGVRALEKFNVKRVVLSRETPLEEIKRIHENSNIEIEYFVHGALCVCFSGNCYLSSYMFDASGNRGKCKQLCRLPYELQFNDKTLANGYLLSAKDFNMLNRLKDLEDAGVISLKIEGRARRPYYVGEITKTYRNAVDGINQQNNIDLAFNRGFTEGYFNGNGNIISNTQNHIGVKVGVVEKFVKGKKFNEIYFTSKIEISPKSTLKFFNKDKEIATISAFDLRTTKTGYVLTTMQEVEQGLNVHLIADNKLETEMLNKQNKIKINVEISAKENEKLYVKTTIRGRKIELYGDVCEKALKHSLTTEELQQNFNKNEYFDVEISANLGSVFIVKQKLNEFRRNFFEKVITTLTKTPKSLEPIFIEHKTSYPLTDFEIVDKPISSKSKTTIFAPETYNLEEIKHFIAECKKLKTKPVLNLPNFALKQDIEMLNSIVKETKIAVLVNNMYAINFETEKYLGGGMNVFNAYSAECYGVPYLSAEGEESIKMPYMTMRHCPMKQHLNGTCANCPYKDGYKYRMQNGKTMQLKRIKMSTCTFYLTD